MSEVNSNQGYEPLLDNPSETISLPVVLSAVFENNGVLTLCAERTYEGAEYLNGLERVFRKDFPKLYEEAAALVAVRSHNADTLITQFDDDSITTTMEYYYRGVTVALSSMIFSAPPSYFNDLTIRYSSMLAEMDMIQKEQWLAKLQTEAQERISPVTEFIGEKYFHLLLDTFEQRSIMKVGTINGYLLLAHSRACIEREKELAWMTRDEESFEGWCDYRTANH